MKVILMHGKNTDPSQKWYPWFFNQMKERGIECLVPILPHASDPDIDEWMNELEQSHPDNGDILIGHSRGGVAILRWLERVSDDKKFKAVILVATNSGDSEKRNRTENNKGFFTKEGYDFDKIKKHCDNFVVFHSKDDQWVPFEAGEENSKGLDAKFLQFEDRGHFGKALGIFPELVEEVLK